MRTDKTIQLRGITWNHTRGYLPMVATAQRFAETHPGVEIIWEKRSLQAFADRDITELAQQYDLLVIDHPWAGYAATRGILLPLQDHLPAEFLQDQAGNSVGASYASYHFSGYQCALAIDAAAPVATYRTDLLTKAEVNVPQTWDELLNLARKGWVAFPGIPIDTLMNFYMLCSTHGQDPFANDEWVVTESLGVQALEQLRELASLVTREIFYWNPIAVYEALSSRDDLAYCPFAYGYSNYARRGYGKRQLVFDDMVTIGHHGRCRTTLGGTGLAVSSACQPADLAVEYARFVAGPECQCTLYVESGGQPGHRSAWLNDVANQSTGNYFRKTLPALDRAYVRPRYAGYLHFQDHAGDVVRDYVMNGGDPKAVLAQLARLYRESKGQTPA
jgi:multiple sugar transport system substrate-binding protein